MLGIDLQTVARVKGEIARWRVALKVVALEKVYSVRRNVGKDGILMSVKQ